MQEIAIEKSLFGKIGISEEKKVLKGVLYDFVEIYPNIGYPFLLFNREKTIAKIKDIKRKLLEVGV